MIAAVWMAVTSAAGTATIGSECALSVPMMTSGGSSKATAGSSASSTSALRFMLFTDSGVGGCSSTISSMETLVRRPGCSGVEVSTSDTGMGGGV